MRIVLRDPLVFLLFALPILSGCPERGVTSDSHGPRLQRVDYVIDGARFPAGYWDEQLELPCSFFLAEDGRMRCLPPSEAWDVVEYLDPACTKPVITRLSSTAECGASSPTYVPYDATVGDVCLEERALGVVEAGSEIPVPSQLYRRAHGHCSLSDYAPSRSWEAERVSVERFASADLVEDELEEGLVVERLLLEDGSRTPRWLRDTDGIGTCAPRMVDGSGRCVSASFVVGDGPSYLASYLDSDCTSPAIPDWAFDGCHSELIYDVSTQTVHEVGAEYEGPLFQRNFEGGCSEYAPRPVDPFYRLGPKVPAETMPRLHVETMGDGDVIVESWRSPSGERVTPWGSPVHVPSGSKCYVMQDRDGRDFCVPVRWQGYLSSFEDSSCTVPLGQLEDPEAPYLVSGSLICSGFTIEGVWEVRGAYEASFAYTLGSSGCERVELDSSTSLVRLGNPLDVDVLPELERVVAR